MSCMADSAAVVASSFHAPRSAARYTPRSYWSVGRLPVTPAYALRAGKLCGEYLWPSVWGRELNLKA